MERKNVWSKMTLSAVPGFGVSANHVSGEHYPQAEWQRARTILMHTPGMELFDGIIHPSAGLFDRYFDEDTAGREHRHYIELLREKGIKVMTVREILDAMPMEELRRLAARELHYDLSHLHATIFDNIASKHYENKNMQEMSRKDLIRCIFLRPIVELYPTEENTGLEARYVHRPLMNLYFTRDQSITTPKGHIICKMNSLQRDDETKVIEACYRYLGQEPILSIKGKGRLEGGDYFPAGDLSFIGCGMRTNEEAIWQIMDADAFGHDTVVVVKDHKHWQMQMHLDTYFNIVDDHLCTMVASRLFAKCGDQEFVTCDIYSRAHGEKDYHLVDKDLSFVDFLKSHDIEIIPIYEEDEMHYANNFLTIAPREIMAVGGQSDHLAEDFRKAGVHVTWVPLENLIGGYGAAHCMTQVLERGL